MNEIVRSKRWIQKSVKEPGALRKYVQRKYGKKGFTKRGTIKKSVARKIAKDPKAHATTRKRARWALTVGKF